MIAARFMLPVEARRHRASRARGVRILHRRRARLSRRQRRWLRRKGGRS